MKSETSTRFFQLLRTVDDCLARAQDGVPDQLHAASDLAYTFKQLKRAESQIYELVTLLEGLIYEDNTPLYISSDRKE